jgi:hypothetical protein
LTLDITTMSTITLDEVKAQHQRLGALIEQLQASATATAARVLPVPEATIELNPGEHYAGLVLATDGSPLHHLVLLPGEGEDLDWEDAKRWADDGGGTLPTRQEQALLYANLKSQFKPAWYWSAESYSEDGSFAWGQYFVNGYQRYGHKSCGGRARAVRRFTA